MSAAPTLDYWQAKAAALTFRADALIGGKTVAAKSGKRFDTVSPIDGRVLTAVASCDAADVDDAVKVARDVFEKGSWSRMAPAQRKKRFIRFAELIEQNREELALLETLDMGKPIRFSSTIDIPAAANAIAWYGEAIDKIYDEIAPTDPSAVALINREPLGVVAAVVPWNFPLLMASWKIGPVLAAGNSLILKPAEQSPLSALRVAELALEAGIPEGVFNVIPGLGPTAGKALGLHMDVDCVTFTGSTEVGKLFMKYAGDSNLKRVSLECGGKSPNIVLADAPDLDAAARAAAFGIFFNQGEVCNAGSRLLVQDSIKDAFLEKVMGVAKRMMPGDPLDPKTMMGAMVDKTQTDRVMSYIEAGKQDGATLKMGGNRARTETGGSYIEPTVFDNVDNRMKIAQEEIFGPVLSTITFKDADEAVKIANDTIFGLASAVWTSNISTAHKVARQLKAGIVWVNSYDAGDITVPFGGYKQSGFGRDRSLHALEKYTQLKLTWIQL
jgi:acyl-CoA reductase-like NAD-dependent aldehyde dehydrogenase